MNYVHIVDYCISECPCVHLETVSLWDKILLFNPDVYIMHRNTNVFLGEALAYLAELLFEDLSLFWYLCLPVIHDTLWTRYDRVIVLAGELYL